MQLHKKISALRKEKKWSQEDLAKKTGFHDRHVSRWERGLSQPSAEALKKLADALGVTTDYLLYDNVPKSKKTQIHDPEFLAQFEEIEKFGEEDKKAIKRILESMIIKNQMTKIIPK